MSASASSNATGFSRRRSVWLGLCLAMLLAAVCAAQGAVLISHPEERIRLIDESAVVVFDPLARSQTTLFRWRLEGSTQPFAVLIPVPETALNQNGPFDRVQRVLHPVGRVREISDSISSPGWAIAWYERSAIFFRLNL